MPSLNTTPAIRTILPILILCTVLFIMESCRRDQAASPAGCISRDQPMISDRLIPAGQFDSVRQFFLASGLSTDTIQPLSFYYSFTDSAGKTFYQVPSRRFINGLPVDNAYLKYDFYDGLLADITSTGYQGTVAGSDTTSHLSLAKLREIYLASDPDHYAYGFFNLVALKPHPLHWADSCIQVTLQYTDNSMLDATAIGHLFVKTWSVHTASQRNTIARIVDETGKIYPTIIYTATN